MDEPAPPPPPLSGWGRTWRVLLALTVSLMLWTLVAERQSDAMRTVELAMALPAFALAACRRRWPLAVAVATALLSTVFSLATGPALLATVSLATRRRWNEIVPVAVLGIAAGMTWNQVQPLDPRDPWPIDLALNAALVSGMCAWGMYIGSRRELVWSLRQRAERAEAEQELRVTGARDAERARIAREMHDVLAHRISQISMHAGALSFREDLSAEEMRAGAGAIRERAHEALSDLRGVLGVLRGEVLDSPQPTYDDLPALVAEARLAGLTVDLDDRLADREPVPEAVGRTLYRIVQEGLTNARKHAPGSTVTVALSGSPEAGVTACLSNPVGFGTSATPGAGVGLVGLRERAELRGGHLSHGREGATFVLRGWIPWAR
ncbi:sensor histidine kinase [Nocardioides sp. zg-DK7169]|uniref:sensor histidine kinase n=1 Tax=Nocardioides sp. zg-DK7169 TaxID=2736600 RepID=UPI003463AA5F